VTKSPICSQNEHCPVLVLYSYLETAQNVQNPLYIIGIHFKGQCRAGGIASQLLSKLELGISIKFCLK